MKYSIVGLLSLVLVYCIPFVFSQEHKVQENEPPKVKFIAPTDGTTFHWNDLVSYEISVSDPEDGESEYDEINENEVFLVVKYLKDSTYRKEYLLSEEYTNYNPVVEMGSRNCLNCHKLNGNLIGPSFQKIAEKYRKEPGATEKLAKKVITGGSNVWGEEIMPSHQDLTLPKAKELVDWILAYNFSEEKDILVGIKGSFRIKKRDEYSNSGVYILTAFYTDHGVNDNSQNRNRGKKHQILTIK